MLGDDPVFAVQNGFPVDGDLAHPFDAVFGGILQVVIHLGIEKQGLGRDAAQVQASAPQLLLPLDQSDLQPILAGADGGCVSSRTAADDDDVVNRFCHSKLPGALASGNLAAGKWFEAKALFYASGLRLSAAHASYATLNRCDRTWQRSSRTSAAMESRSRSSPTAAIAAFLPPMPTWRS